MSVTNDYISRQAAIQPEITNEEIRFALKQLGAYFSIKIRDKKEGDVPVELLQRIEEIQEYVDNLPSAQPSAQPGPIRINLNEPIKVKLTDWGKEIYYHKYDRTNQIAGREICKPSFPKEDENGYAEFQLWCFIELYGIHIGMALPNVIEPLEIVYER